MPDWISVAMAWLPEFDALAVLALRCSTLVALGWLAAVLLRRALPGARQALWTAVIAGLLALPVLTVALPGWQVLPFGLSATTTPAPRPDVDAPTVSRARDLPAPVSSVRAVEAQSSPAWTEWAVLVWACGACLVATVFGSGLWRLRRLGKEGRSANDGLRRLAVRAAEEFGVRRPVRLLVSSRVASPGTWGLVRPVIVIPEVAETWSRARTRMVLAHEMAHVARFDWGWRLLSQLGCAAYWFDPLAWLAARRLRFEQELACDQAVVERGARPSLYAHHLLNIARAAVQGRALPVAALDMARRTQMEGRLMSILADRPHRRLHRTLLVPALSIVAALPVLAAVQPLAPAPVVPAPTERVAALAPGPEPAAASSAHPIVTPAPPAAPLPAVAPDPVLAVAPRVRLSDAVLVAPSAAPVAMAALASMGDREEDEWEERIAAKAAEIEELMAPIQEEIERTMEETMSPLIEQMEALELESRPFAEEMSRIGDEMSQRLMETMPDQLEIEERSQRAEAIALEIERRTEVAEALLAERREDREAMHQAMEELRESLEPLREQMRSVHRELAERHRSSAEMEELIGPYRERMEELRESMRPQQERMEELSRQLEPMRLEMESLREERMAEVRARLDALRAELQALREQRRAELRERHQQD